jgi:hypothetical protein
MRALLLLSAALFAAPAIAQGPTYRTTIGPSPDTGKIYGNWKRAPHIKGLHTLDNVLIKDVSKTCRDDCLEIEDNSGPVTVQGGTWRHVGSPDKISAAFTNQNGNLILNGVTAIGGYNPTIKTAVKFPNTDLVMSAQRTFLTINGGSFSNAWDAGIDTKATTTMTGKVAVDNSRVSLKVWGPLVGDTLVSRNARDGDVACLKSPVVTCKIHLRKLIVWNDDPNGLLVGFQGSDGIVQIDECENHVRPTYRTSWIKPGSKNTKLILGPTCAKDGKVVVAPVKPVASPAAQIVDAGQLLPDGDGDGLIALGSKWAKALGLKASTVVRHLDGFRYQVVP